jgi:transcriptional regulator with XRE-family HTH domain
MRAVSTPGLADPAAGAECTLVPGSLQRVREMAVLREQGWSLQEIAGRYKVSRERVRQILNAQGGPDRPDVLEARRRRAERLAEARIDELLALWRMGTEPAAIASGLGLRAAACRSTIERFATDVDRVARRTASAGTRAAPTYSDDDLVAALTSTATRLGRTPSAKEYAAVAREGDLPSVPTILNRMGGWSNALSTAGLRTRAASSHRRRRWTEPACWEALRRVTDELGEIPSVLAYERLAAGRSDLPSSATIRNRLGRWSSLAARLAAQRELTTQTQTRARTAAGALVGA